MGTRNRTGCASGARLVLTLIVPLALGLAPLLAATGQGWAALAAEANRQVAFTFTPEVTPIPPTGTPMATALATLGPQPSPLPLAPTAGPTGGTPEPPQAISGGDEDVGYDFLEGSDPPLWRIWYQGEEIIVNASDPAASSLLAAFMLEAQERANAVGELADAEETLDLALAGAGFGLVALVGGGIAAVASCSATPLTFYFVGGTGWLCVGGGVSAVGGLGALGVSAATYFQALRDRGEAIETIEESTRDAQQLFDTLSSIAGSPSTP
ncbi:MAG: hypothetical protein AB1449_13685 [Chloroflexota bacterium]